MSWFKLEGGWWEAAGKRGLLQSWSPAPAPGPSPSGGPPCVEYENTVLAMDFPDPSSPVLGTDGYYYSFATNADDKNIQVTKQPWGIRALTSGGLPRYAVPALKAQGSYLDTGTGAVHFHFTSRVPDKSSQEVIPILKTCCEEGQRLIISRSMLKGIHLG